MPGRRRPGGGGAGAVRGMSARVRDPSASAGKQLPRQATHEADGTEDVERRARRRLVLPQGREGVVTAAAQRVL